MSDITHDTKQKPPDTHGTCCDSTSVVSSVEATQPWGSGRWLLWLESLGGGAVCRLQTKGGFWGLGCVLSLAVCWLYGCVSCEVTDLRPYDFCTFLHAHCTSIKSLQEQQTTGSLNCGDRIQNNGSFVGAA